jgi:hypothetical protein
MMVVIARGDQNAAARALVDKAIQAHGGEAKLSSLPPATTKIKGIYYEFGEAFAITGESIAHFPDHGRFIMEAEVDGQKSRIVAVRNGNKGWIKINDDTREMESEELDRARDECYAGWVACLLPLKDDAFDLRPLGEVNIDKRPAMGVAVSRKNCPDVNLYFDKESGLLVKTTCPVKENDRTALTEETILKDYGEVQGVKKPMKIIMKVNGMPYMEVEVTVYRVEKKLDDSIFAKP